MSSNISQLLADHLDVDASEADEMLQELVTRIKRQVAENGEAHVPGLGTFHPGDGDSLHFEPDESLASAVNHRFVGLEPVTVDVAQEVPSYAKNEVFREEEEGTEPGEEAVAPSDEADEAAAVPPVEEPQEEAPSEEADEETAPLAAAAASDGDTPASPVDAPEGDEELDDVGDRSTEQAAEQRGAEAAAIGEEPAEKAEETFAPPTEETGTPQASADQPEPASDDQDARPSRSRATSRRHASTDSPSLLPWIVVVLLIVAGTGVYWYFYRQPPAAGPSTGQVTTNEPAGQTEPPASEQASPDASAPSVAGESGPEEYTLPSGLNPAEGGFTIIVASETSRAVAETTLRRFAELFSDEDLPMGIVEATVDGVQRYRVGVGQFATASEVRDAQERLQGRLPDGAWAVQLDPDS